jgi:hypothetical protein
MKRVSGEEKKKRRSNVGRDYKKMQGESWEIMVYTPSMMIDDDDDVQIH